VLPFLKGERSPGWNADVRAAVVGLSAATTPRDVLQAAMESIAYRFSLVAEELHQVVPGARRIVASGGGAANSHVWLQIIADVLNRPIELAEEPETTSRGAAILALETLGVDISGIPPPPIVRDFQPNPSCHARYRHGRERQQRLYRMLADWGRQTSRSG
jgi:gluconokinase